MPSFAELPDPIIGKLEKHVRWLPLRPGERFAEGVTSASESYYFVQQGRLNVVLDPKGSEDSRDWQYVASFDRGDFFSDGYVQLADDRPQIDCVADVSSVLACVPGQILAKVMEANPTWARALTGRNKEMRDAFRDNRPASRRLVQDFFLRHGHGFAAELKVVQLDRCINCNACEKHCAARHGIARLTRFGPALGVLAFPISCRHCVDHRCSEACAFDAITVHDDGSVTMDRRKCAGCSACQSVCPNEAIEMAEVPYTADDFPNPMPQTDPEGLTNIPGLYLIGEAAGDALIKIAINSGVRAADAAAEQNQPSASGAIDVAIVGAGPAGLAAALACRQHGLSYLVVEKDTIASTIQAYPRNKLVMAEPAHLPVHGELWLRDTTKEELIAKWLETIAATGLEVRTHEEVRGIERTADGTFSLTTSKRIYRAQQVIVAVGTRGAPRTLGLPGESSERVKYMLSDAREYAGQRVLVIGGGDSAIETALSLADADGTTVTISYRRDAFTRANKRNRQALEQYQAAGRIDVVLKSQVIEIQPGRVKLQSKKGVQSLANDTIFALLGAEPPTKFFESIGINIITPGSEAMERFAASRGTHQIATKCDACSGYDSAACVEACPTGALVKLAPADVFYTRSRKSEPFSELAFLVGLDRVLGKRTRRRFVAAGIGTVLVAAIVGLEVLLRLKAPALSLQHTWLTWSGRQAEVAFGPGRGLGLGLGIVGASLMAFAMLYPLNSRLGWFQWLAKKRMWMGAHIWAGLVGPLLVTYHTGFKLDRWPSIAIWAGWIVVLTGFAGRFLRSWFRRSTGLAQLEMQSLNQERQRLFNRWGYGRTAVFAAADIGGISHPPALLTPFVLLWRQLSTWLRQTYLRFVRLRYVQDRGLRRAMVRNFVERARAARTQLLGEAVERSIAFWRVFHLLVTIILLTVATLHIVLAYLYMAS